MSDLISRGILIKALGTAKETCKGLHEYFFFDAVLAMVDSQPTAHDVDRVVEQLGHMDKTPLYEDEDSEEIIDYLLEQSEVIEIVKRGGKDE